MRPTTPKFDFTSRTSRPSSPPETPIVGTFQFGKNNNQKARRRSTINLSRPMPRINSEIEPIANTHHFSYNPYSRNEELSPRSSSPSSDASGSPPRSLSPSPYSRPGTPQTSPPTYVHIRTVPHRDSVRANFVLSEFSPEDESGDDAISVIHPTHYESAHPSQAPSRVPSRSPNRPPREDSASPTPSPPHIYHPIPHSNRHSYQSQANDLDARVLSDYLASLSCGSGDERERRKKRDREIRRRKRLSSGSIGKRNFSQSIDGETDEEDLELPVPGGMELNNEAVPGSARRLRRKTNDSVSGMSTPRSPIAGFSSGFARPNSLLFEDPPRMGVLREMDGEDEGDGEIIDRGVEVPDVSGDFMMDVFLSELRGFAASQDGMDVDSGEDDSDDSEEEEDDDDEM